MRLLLETHTFLWFLMGDTQLSPTARALIQNTANQKWVSTASAWEMAIKHQLGKLPLTEPLEVLLPREISQNGFLILPVQLPHAFAVANLPLHHRDPFDRLLIAQAQVEHLDIVSKDLVFDEYSAIKRLW